MEKRSVRIGSRGSKLALWQSEYLQARLDDLGVASTIKVIKTKGDRIQDIGFSKMEGKGFFTKEIEEELLGNHIDVAVHSMKDLPTDHPEGLCISGVSYREDPADCLLIHPDAVDEKMPWSLKQYAVVGTSSARRKAQLAELRKDTSTKDIRGNVPTRIEKLKSGEFDAIVLALAGINRLQLDLENYTKVRLHPREFVPAPAQGVLAYQTRKEDITTRKLLAKISDAEVASTISIERKVLNKLDGGCQLPLGVYVEKDGRGFYHAYAALGSIDGTIKRCQISHSTHATLAEAIYTELTESKQ